MDHPAHQTKIRQWLDETKKQMMGFLESMNEREMKLIQKRQENRQLCNEYIAQVSKRQSQARRQASAMLSCCMQDTRSTREILPASPHWYLLTVLLLYRTKMYDSHLH